MCKKIVALLLAMAMVFSLTACGGGSSSGKEGSQSNSDELDWTAGADAEGGEVTIRFSTWRKSDEAYFQEIIKRFEEKYDWIDVELEITPDASAYYTNLQADLIGGTAPDVFDMHSGDTMVTYIDNGMIAPQTDFDYMANYSDTGKTATSLDGENYGFLIAYNYFGLLYNKEIFNKVGVTAPTTPDELVDVVNKLRDAGYDGIIYPGKTNGVGIGSAIQLGSMGTENYATLRKGIDDGSVVDISTAEGVTEAFNTLVTYTKNNVYYNAYRGIVYETGMTLFAQEKSALVYSGSYVYGEQDTYFPEIEAGFFPIPTYANNGLCYAEGAQVSCINAAGANLGAAKLWVEFLATPEISEYYCSNAKMFSTIAEVEPQFEEMEMIKNACSGYAIKPLEKFDNEMYWMSGLEKIYEATIYDGTEDIEGLIRVYRSQLEEYDLANQ
ncbi:MAG: extracellular solute-binding protein [Tyzzerella sp.]|nr:extracellular solute-binding protein [Tyzzerella sp.]